MGTTFNKLLENNLVANQIVKDKLLQLDKHIILSKGEHAYRFNILDLHHKKHQAVIINKDKLKIPHDKEWAFGHIIIIGNNIYFSEKTTNNKEVEQHKIVNKIYHYLETNEIRDIDRQAKLIDVSNVDFIVESILVLREKELIP